MFAILNSFAGFPLSAACEENGVLYSVSKDERRGIQFRGTQVIQYVYLVHIDALTLLLVH